jgi:ACS family glucarate transporter-like MFS transporter
VRSGNFWAILLMGLSFGYGNYFFLGWLPTYLVRARNFSERDLLLSTLPFIFGACANVGSGVTSDFLLKRFGLKAARCRIGMIGLTCGGLFALLAAVTPSKWGTLLLLCMSYAGLSFHWPMTFQCALMLPGSSPARWLVRRTQRPRWAPFFLVSFSAMLRKSPAVMTSH